MQEQYDDDQTSSPEESVRLIVDITPELSQGIKTVAAKNNLSVQEYVVYLLEQAVFPEKPPTKRPHRPLNREAVDRLLRHHEEMMRAHASEEFTDSVELLRQAREDRRRELEGDE